MTGVVGQLAGFLRRFVISAERGDESLSRGCDATCWSQQGDCQVQQAKRLLIELGYMEGTTEGAEGRENG